MYRKYQIFIIAIFLLVGCQKTDPVSSAENGGCSSLPSAENALCSSQYCVGDTINDEDLNQEFDVCFGEYQTPTFKLQDFQGKVIWLQFSASW